MEEEIFRDIPGYESLYRASNKGRILSLHSNPPRFLKAAKKETDYLIVGLCKNGKSKTYGVQYLVGRAFPDICGEWFEGAEANHIDGNRSNNVPENINWLSHDANVKYSQLKPVGQYTLDGVLLKTYSSTIEAARQTGLSQGNIVSCCQGKRHTCGGYVWRYV